VELGEVGLDAGIQAKELAMRAIKFRREFLGLKLLVAALGVTILALSSASPIRGQGEASQARHKKDEAKELAMKITEPFTFAAVGDILAPRRPVGQFDDPGFQALMKVMRAADMTYANLEGQIINPSDPDYRGPQVPIGEWLPITITDDLKLMGIRVVTTANNQAMNAGNDAMFETNRLLDAARITHAGSGKNLEDARQPHFGGTPKGEIGVVGMFSIDPTSNPDRPVRFSNARDNTPGVNPLHLTPYNIVTEEQMASLRNIRDAVFAHRSEVRAPVAPVPPNESLNELTLFGTNYRVGDKVGAISYRMDARDLAGIIQSVRDGKQNSDFMIVAIHCHQNSFSYQEYSHDNSVPDFLVELAHAAIDNGADVFVGTGVHTLRGVEIYKGKPIFYGLNSFFNVESSPVYTDYTDGIHQPDDGEVLLTTSRYEGGKLMEVRLYPADLGVADRPTSKVGIPMTPSPEQAQLILKHLQEMSKPFGTTISIENGVGVINVAQTK
jgi:poly-gamma-glutamate capsule biosynthesis protein CapA/YwtB (metallophosphatase superfamily)